MDLVQAVQSSWQVESLTTLEPTRLHTGNPSSQEHVISCDQCWLHQSHGITPRLAQHARYAIPFQSIGAPPYWPTPRHTAVYPAHQPEDRSTIKPPSLPAGQQHLPPLLSHDANRPAHAPTHNTQTHSGYRPARPAADPPEPGSSGTPSRSDRHSPLATSAAQAACMAARAPAGVMQLQRQTLS